MLPKATRTVEDNSVMGSGQLFRAELGHSRSPGRLYGYTEYVVTVNGQSFGSFSGISPGKEAEQFFVRDHREGGGVTEHWIASAVHHRRKHVLKAKELADRGPTTKAYVGHDMRDGPFAEKQPSTGIIS